MWTTTFDSRKAPTSDHHARRSLRDHENLEELFRRKKSRKPSKNPTIHFNRILYIVDSAPEALKRRGKEVEVHEAFGGRVVVRIEGLDVRAVPFEPEGGVRQHDIDDNKYLATTLAKIRQDQIARDEEKLIRLKTLREKSNLKASLDARR